MGTGRGDGYAGFRERLVEQLRSQGVRDLAVLRAIGETPRHLFVPEALRERAYEDVALPIGRGQTISQPSTQARYLESLALTGKERVLEVGTGSGYQAALLAHLAAQVFSIERLAELASVARRALEAASLRNVTVLLGDGTLGWRAYSPYDTILVAAAGPEVPRPLVEQLADGGRLVMALQGGTGGRRDGEAAGVAAAGAPQELVRLTRRGQETQLEHLGTVSFVPLIGRHGFPPGQA